MKRATSNPDRITLRRYTSSNHLAQAARAVLQNSTQIAQMLNGLNRVDFHHRLRAVPVYRCTSGRCSRSRSRVDRPLICRCRATPPGGQASGRQSKLSSSVEDNETEVAGLADLGGESSVASWELQVEGRLLEDNKSDSNKINRTFSRIC
ncbi:brg-1 associated factor [Culex quinquefasciatus]|uniref:Brg-1 associated factor n=1 Tax=Culex quinquefasciatus TaxID=7176 RepID=B0W4P7_CULQU|nr:brg-1 associated factor [Culex quinquefasciatus]|eukprot:XP_001843681.1 brg-1 associated factor [Culex quinquefasciatus]